jgi:hypothetical protein
MTSQHSNPATRALQLICSRCHLAGPAWQCAISGGARTVAAGVCLPVGKDASSRGEGQSHRPDESGEDQGQVLFAPARREVNLVSTVHIAEPDATFPVEGLVLAPATVELPVANFMRRTGLLMTMPHPLHKRFHCTTKRLGQVVHHEKLSIHVTLQHQESKRTKSISMSRSIKFVLCEFTRISLRIFRCLVLFLGHQRD